MQPSQELMTAKFITTPADDELLGAAPPAAASPRPTTSWRLAFSAVGVAVVATIFGTVSIGMFRSAEQPDKRSTFGADLFLWAIGSGLTWDEYQAKQRARGLGRLDENEYDWTQQAFNDAYIGDWDPENRDWDSDE